MCKPEHIVALCLTVINGGASALRLEGIDNIKAVRKNTSLPIVGITKTDGLSNEERLDQVYITPTYDDAKAVAQAGADIIALDATNRPRPDGLSLKETIEKIHSDLDKPVWADVDSFDQAKQAAHFGADLVSTTLFGYTTETQKDTGHGPDFQFLEKCIKDISKPVILEGRVWSVQEAARAIELGAHAVVVGSAITRPHLITKRFVDALTSMNVD